MDEPDVIAVPIDGVLDLHAFHPSEVKQLVADYLEECRKQGILHVRIIHGKGSGQLRRIVHSVLGRSSFVAAFHLAGEDAGGWGATLVDLKPGSDRGQGPAGGTSGTAQEGR
jgi:DNA-nicking Smr family endonuclease